jgi:hypothetical protein
VGAKKVPDAFSPRRPDRARRQRPPAAPARGDQLLRHPRHRLVLFLAYAYNAAEFAAESKFLCALVGFVVLVSIVLHGATSTPAMRYLERKWQTDHAPAD